MGCSKLSQKKRPDFEIEGQRGYYANRYRLVGSDVMSNE